MLLAHYPLLSNGNNQGLDDINLTTMGTVTYTAGKLGNSATFTGSSTNCLHRPGFKLADNFSWSCWFKISNAISSTQYILSEGRDMGSLGFNLLCANYILYLNNLTITTISAGIWYHVVITVNSSDKIKIYLNGELVTSHTYFIPDYAQSNNRFVIGKMAYSYTQTAYYFPLNGQVCDVRIYDHCLSALEIKELSKGLILNYRLSGVGGENLIKDSNITYNNNSYCICDYMPSTFLTVGETYTITICATPATAVSYCSLFTSSGYANLAQIYFTTTKKQILSKTFTMQYYSGREPSVNESYGRLQIYRYPNDGTVIDNTIIHWVKIEKGNKATPWCPNSEDDLYSAMGFNDGIEYDCSGYGNHGTKYGTISWSGDSPRYSGSYIPTTSSSYIKSNALVTSGFSNSYTISYWGKISSLEAKMAWGFGDGNKLNLYPHTEAFCHNTGDGATNPFQNNGTNVKFSSYNGDWHHYTITGNGTTTTLYIDGIKVGTAKTYKPITGTVLFISGWNDSTSYKWVNGNLSDFRLYSTCLSENDVKFLYDTSASLSNTGVITAYEFVEVE